MNRKIAAGAISAFIAMMPTIQAQSSPASRPDVRLNVTVGATGHLRTDGKGEYRTGEDFVAAWLNPTRWPDMAFDICMNWPFDRYPGASSTTLPRPSGTHDNRTLIHRVTSPVAPNGIVMGIFTGPGGGNDVAIAKPLTTTVDTFTDMRVGTSVSPQSTEVRFCNAGCTQVFSLIFGESSVFGYRGVNGVGTTKPTVARISETAWRITFPTRTIGRLWNRTTETPVELGLYHYEGTLDLRAQ